MRRGPPNRGEDEPPPELHSIHRGKVASIKDYGVFVEMEGRRRHGLVHISQVSGSRIEAEDLPTIVEVGEAVWVKVISLAVRSGCVRVRACACVCACVRVSVSDSMWGTGRQGQFVDEVRLTDIRR
jgi:DNA-directed RNA polymerase subunit E'/Rpb7